MKSKNFSFIVLTVEVAFLTSDAREILRKNNFCYTEVKKFLHILLDMCQNPQTTQASSM